MKRSINGNNEENAEKRHKLTIKDDIEAMWGDSDPDIDEYLIIASQICEKLDIKKENKSTNGDLPANDSILSYTNFNPNRLVASTQLETSLWPCGQSTRMPPPAINNHPGPSTSNANKNILNFKHIEEELEKLRQEVVAKDGEVTILRSQLKQTKQEVEQVYLRQTQENHEKLQVVTVARDKINTELGFKNLEIANLKCKLANLTRNFMEATYHDQTTVFGAINPIENVNVVQNQQTEQIIIPSLQTKYPLKSVISLKIFESNKDDKFPSHTFSFSSKLKHKKEERHLHSLLFPNPHEQRQLHKGVYTYIKFKETLKLKHFFPAVRLLMQASQEDLFSETDSVKQIYLLTNTLLVNHLEYLTRYMERIQVDEIREYDLLYLNNPDRVSKEMISFDDFSLFDPTKCCEDECAMQTRQCVALLGAIYPHNEQLQNIIINNKLHLNEQERATWPFAFPTQSATNANENFLNLLFKITKIIGQTRVANYYTGLLSSISYLLSQIVETSPLKNMKAYTLIAQLTKEIVLTIPPQRVLLHLSELFRNGSNCKLFVSKLCAMPQCATVQKKRKKGIMIVNNNCCVIEVYFALCREALNNDSGDFRMHLNLVEFAMNAIGFNVKWLHFTHENKNYGCQIEFSTLIIEILYAVLKKYKTLRSANEKVPRVLITLVKLCPKVLAALNHILAELIEFTNVYNSFMKSAKGVLNTMEFDSWNEFEVESIVRQTENSSPPPENTWLLLNQESLTNLSQ